MTTQALPCRLCGSCTNGYFSSIARTCKKCKSKKEMAVKQQTATRLGFKNYYQLQKFKNFL